MEDADARVKTQLHVPDWHSHLLSSANLNPASRRTSPLAGRRLSTQGWSVETSTGLHARSHHEEVGPLSRGVTLKPLSGRLQPGLRFFPDPLPAYPTAFLAISLPVKERADIRAYPVPHRQHEQVRSCLSTGGARRRRVPISERDIRPHTVLVRACFAVSALL